MIARSSFSPACHSLTASHIIFHHTSKQNGPEPRGGDMPLLNVIGHYWRQTILSRPKGRLKNPATHRMPVRVFALSPSRELGEQQRLPPACLSSSVFEEGDVLVSERALQTL
jgi:hypothetical protein